MTGETDSNQVFPLVVSFFRSRVTGSKERTSIRLEIAAASKEFTVWSLTSPYIVFDCLGDVLDRIRGFLVEAIKEISQVWETELPVVGISPRYLFFGIDPETEKILKKEFESLNLFLTSEKGEV